MALIRLTILIFIHLLFFHPLRASVLPQTSIPSQAKVEQNHPQKKSENKSKKAQKQGKRKKKALLKLLAMGSGGVIIVWILFGIPSFVLQILSFIASFSALKGNYDPYFQAMLLSGLSGLWALIGGLFIKKQEGIKAYNAITLAIPALLFLIFAVIQLFAILFGADAGNFLLSLLTILLAGTLMLFAQLLGF